MKKYERENRIDKRTIEVSYQEIIKKHPYLTNDMIKKMQRCLWTYSEIMEWEKIGNIFYPKGIFSGNIEMEIQYFPLWLFSCKKWRQSIKKFIRKNKQYASQ